jgi:ATP-dependent Clp protease ATP-binding subunit ClpB
LKRAIQQYLENPLAQMILKGEYMPGDVISITASGSDMVFVPAIRAQQAS